MSKSYQLQFQKKDFVENGRPCIHYGQMYTHFGIAADKTLTFVNEEVFSSRVASVNPSAIVMNINGLTGQGTYELSTLLYDENNLENIKERQEDVLNNQIEKLKLKLNEFSEELSESEVNRLNLEVINFTFRQFF